MIRVVVAEDQHIVRQGLCRLLEDLGDIKVVGETDTGSEAVKLTLERRPDVLVLDISMPEMDGLDALKQMRLLDPRPKVVILSIHADIALVERALDYGALGYVLKQSVSDELLDAVKAASRGSVYLSSGVSHVLMHYTFTRKPHDPLDRLSPREREVVGNIILGLSTKQIADALHTSTKTVEKQRRDAMRKLEVDNVASLVRVCLELGLSGKPSGTS